MSALKNYPGGMQYGGGVNPDNAQKWLDAGASHVIVTSYVFKDGKLDWDKSRARPSARPCSHLLSSACLELVTLVCIHAMGSIFDLSSGILSRLKEMVATVGKEKLVLDLSCRAKDGKYFVCTDRWQKFTDLEVNGETLKTLAAYCDEFLVHGVDVEGKMAGIEDSLVELLGEESPIPCTYAGGAMTMGDLDKVKAIGEGQRGPRRLDQRSTSSVEPSHTKRSCRGSERRRSCRGKSAMGTWDSFGRTYS